MKEYKIIAWEGRKGWAYCLNCGDRDELYQPLYRDDFIGSGIVRCIRCEELIRGGFIAVLIDGISVSCLECAGSEIHEPLVEQDFSPGENVVCHRCGKIIKE